MVLTYKRTSNPMMNRPVVKEEIVDFMRERQTQITGPLKNVETFAHENNIPIIPHETVVYFQMLLDLMKPQRILEIGTAIGFSALMMAEAAPDAEIITIDRNPEMIALAKDNLATYDVRKQITLLEGDAADLLADLLADLQGEFDFIFMDSAKSKYVEFLPRAMELLSENGVIIMDDIFQGGEILIPIMEIKRTQRALERGLRRLFDEVLDNPKYRASMVPLGDGILMIKKV
ncbi:O-methyltransferase [Lactococcus formosensis]|uniref:tRNA 5-hydroxyuridine methyltransferase n=1 Tax=Lactococcus formosensis TaxID=1281486 RepID=A0A9X4SHQ8_9LACT|nr:O-methyltransferase [Lactococcus formosensis]MDG6142216.1 O-methyltransferase [Lactococcus formosensis]MDG6159421.1 O-methyltransferase [Lactococcus formosensis]MDG6165655.1 O-methyltransferase [Lactococcus formosensis]MDG6172108.1 O-methyltransferase [Lactococcus formosensis]MDG6192875.1 O-methyltransferase [Lactococcus formosensis]